MVSMAAALGGALLGVAAAASSVLAQPVEQTRVRFSVNAVPTVGTAQITLAKQYGLFAKHGLDVERKGDAMIDSTLVRRLAAAALVAGATSLWAGTAAALDGAPTIVAQAADPKPAEPVRVKFAILNNRNAGYAAFALAKERGLFAKHGLDVEFVSIDAVPAGLAALAAGQVQFTYSGPNIVDAVVAGLPVALIFAINNAPNIDICVAASVRTARDLAGKSIATLNRGTAFDIALRLWLQDQGLAESDVTIRNINTGAPGMLAAMTSGQAEGMTATATGPSSCGANAARGYHVLADISATGLQLFNAGIATSRRYLETNRSAVKGAVAAMIEAEKLFKENRDVAFAHIREVENLTDPAAIEFVWNFHKSRWADPPLVADQAVQAAVRYSLSEKTRTEGPALVSIIYDNSLVMELTAK